MGRKNIAISKVPLEVQRKAIYRSRCKNVLKKANEISTLTDAQVVCAMFPTTDKIHCYSSQPGTWKILQRFIQNIPENQREIMEISQDTISSINEHAGHHDIAEPSSSDAPDRERNEREIIDGQIKQMLLPLQEKMLHPGMEVFESDQEFGDLLQGLENIYELVDSRRNIQAQFRKQQMQAGPEAGTRGPLHGQEQMQQQRVRWLHKKKQQRVRFTGIEDSAPLAKSDVTGPSDADMPDTLLRGNLEQMLKSGTMGYLDSTETFNADEMIQEYIEKFGLEP